MTVRFRPGWLTRVATAVAVTAVATATACSSSSGGHTSSNSATIKTDTRLHASLPAALRERGVLRIATDATYAPASSYAANGRTIIGFDADLGMAIAKVLGLKGQVIDHDFQSLRSFLNAGHTDLIMSAMTDTAARERQVDFVDYFSAGTAIVVQRGNPAAITDLGSLCGLSVAVEAGTVQQSLLAAEQKRCGAKKMTVHATGNNSEALLLVRTGRAKAILLDYPPAALVTTAPATSDLYQLATTAQYEPAPYGVGVSKKLPALRNAVRDALTELMKSGAYRAILRKWHVQSGALDRVTVNSAGGAAQSS